MVALCMEMQIDTTAAPGELAGDERYLVSQAQQGDLDAFNQLVLQYQDRVYSLALRILRDEIAADDMTQVAFMHAYQKLSSFAYRSSFRVWLLRIATNLCLDELRRRKRHPLLSLDHEQDDEDDTSLLDQLVSAAPAPEQEVLRREREEIIRLALQRLPLDLRMSVELVDVQELDYNQAAQVMGCPVGTVKSRLARARMRLRDQLSALR